MLSPYKLYKHDMPKARVAVTQGPKGKPPPGCKGTMCYEHKNVDWTLHRLAPAIHARTPKGSMRRKMIENAMSSSPEQAKKHPSIAGMTKTNAKHTGHFLKKMSPRWGEGKAPGRRPRKIVPIPPKGEVEVSKKTYVASAAALGGTGTVAVKHQQRRAEGNHGQKRTY